MSFKNRDSYFLPTLAICFGVLALMLFEPLSFDNAIYQQMAREIYQYHRLPYVETWDQNFPGIIYMHYTAIRLFGIRDSSVRVFDLLLQLGFCAVFYSMLRMWLKDHIAAVATVLYASFYVAEGMYMYFERDPYAAMCCITAFYLVFRPYRSVTLRSAAFVVSGLLAGYAILLKPTAALYLLPILMWMLMRETHSSWLKRGVQLALYLCVALIPLGIFLFAYAHIPGGLHAFYLATIQYNLDIYAGSHSELYYIFLNLVRTAFLFPAAAYGYWLIRLNKTTPYFREDSSKRLPLLYYAALAVTFATVVIQGKYWRYQWMPFCMVLMPLAAIAIEAVAQRMRTPFRQHYAIIAGIIACSFIQMNPKSQVSVLYAITHRQPIYGNTYDFASTSPDYGIVAERATIHYLDAQGVKDREVEIASFDAHLRLDFPHEALQAFEYLYPISDHPLEPGNEHTAFPLTSYQREWQRAYFDTLRESPPRYFVISLSKEWGDAESTLRLIPGFDTFFAAHYVHDTAFGSYQVYRRK